LRLVADAWSVVCAVNDPAASADIASASRVLNIIGPREKKSPKSFCLQTIWATRGLQIES